MGIAMAATGIFFPFFSPLIGWLGVAMTGSDTSSNVLFGTLQQVSARQLDLSPVLMVAANSSGGVMGKMIDAQSIVVASTVTGGRPDSPEAGVVLRDVFWHSLALAGLMSILVMLMAYLVGWEINVVFMKPSVLYGRNSLSVTLPSSCAATIVEKKRMPILPSPAEVLSGALENGCAGEDLASLALSSKSACILICDITRPVPNGLILPQVIKTLLHAGIPADQICVLLCHRFAPA